MKEEFYARLARTHARSQPGTRISSFKPFYRRAKFTAIGAIRINKVRAVMTRNNSINAAAFDVFIEEFLCLTYGQEQ
jgi:hypothetical protein